MQKYTHTVILIHRMTSQDDWWSFSLQIEMFSIVTFKFPDWIVLICSRTYRWWSSCKVMRVVSYRLMVATATGVSLLFAILPTRELFLRPSGHFAQDLDFLLLKPNIDISRFSVQTLVSLQSRQWMSLCEAVVRLVRCVQHYLSTIWILTPRHSATPRLRFTHPGSHWIMTWYLDNAARKIFTRWRSLAYRIVRD